MAVPVRFRLRVHFLNKAFVIQDITGASFFRVLTRVRIAAASCHLGPLTAPYIDFLFFRKDILSTQGYKWLSNAIL